MSLKFVLALVLAIAAITASAAPASAFELFGIRFFGEDPDAPPPSPDALDYSVEFTLIGDEKSLRNALRGASQLIDGADEPVSSPATLLALARGDYPRLLAVLYAQGRYGPTISITVDGREASEIPVDATFGAEALVEMTIDAGPEFLFGDVELVNRPGPLMDEREEPPTPEELGLVPGGVAKSTIVLGSESALINRWRERAHPKARIARRTAKAFHDRDELDVYMEVDPGRPAVFGETTVSGTDRMDPAFVAYYAGITPGEPFDPDDLDRARDQLRRLQVFQAVRLREADTIRQNGELPIFIDVAERKRRVFGGGLQFSTLDGVGAQAYWRHRNLFGRAERLQVEARVGGVDAQDPDEYNYRVGVSFQKPGVFTPYTDLKTSLFAEQDSPDTFRARTITGRLGLEHRFTDRLSGEIYGQVEASTIDQTTVGDGDFLMLSVPTALRYDGSDSELDPTRGVRVEVNAEPFYEAVNGNFGLVSLSRASAYFSPGTDRFVLAGRVEVGSIVGPPLQQIPANRLFFAGGGGSIRGYPYKGVGPQDAFGNVFGGRSLFTASLEARVKITDTIGVVPFVDAGNAFVTEYPDFSEPLKVGVGLGVRYYTGFGPIRLDVAVPLDPLEGDPNVAFYIGLGQAF